MNIRYVNLHQGTPRAPKSASASPSLSEPSFGLVLGGEAEGTPGLGWGGEIEGKTDLGWRGVTVAKLGLVQLAKTGGNRDVVSVQRMTASERR